MNYIYMTEHYVRALIIRKKVLEREFVARTSDLDARTVDDGGLRYVLSAPGDADTKYVAHIWSRLRREIGRHAYPQFNRFVYTLKNQCRLPTVIQIIITKEVDGELAAITAADPILAEFACYHSPGVKAWIAASMIDDFTV
jgi:hypothetical protein